MPRNHTSPDTEALLRTIAEGTARATGADFLRSLVRTVAATLDVRIAFVAEFLDDNTIASILACWNGEEFEEPSRYDLDGTPCQTVLDGEIHCYPDHVMDLFPAERVLEPLNIRSYLAVPLIASSGEVIGHLAVLDDQPMSFAVADLDVFRIFGARAGAEIERKRTGEAVIASEERLARILDSAMDAIVTIDADGRITLFNRAAERIFGCAAAWALNQPLHRFLSKPLRALIDDRLAQGDGGHGNLWIPDGHTALRANGESFPIEATLSSLEVGGRRFHTLILRDVNDRQMTRAEIDQLRQQNVFLREEMMGTVEFAEMIGQTPVMRQLFATIETVARSDSIVLIHGETGTGKEQVAQAIHNLGARRDRLLVKMNCAALPAELIESEMFGHEKGAFTGATALRKGRFEMADGGTLFLDEVGELSLPAQAKLLRVVQEREFERVGGSRTLRVDVRVIAASNRDLEAMVRSGGFRADLYYRLNVLPIEVPPLRARADDIPRLALHFLDKYARKLGRSYTGIETGSMQRLLRYRWPGNVRELQNIIERAAVLATGNVLTIRDALENTAADGEPAGGGEPPLTMDEVEAAHVRKVLQQCRWVIEGKRGAAAILGLEPSTLRYRMQKLGIRRPAAGSDD